MFRKYIALGWFSASLATFALVGCGKSQPTTAPHVDSKPDGKKDDHGDHKPEAGKKDDHGDHKPGDVKKDDHEHKPGSHGGMMVSLGKDSYHAEVVFGKGGKINLYMLGKDESKAQEVDAHDLNGFVTPEGATEPVPVSFKPQSQPSDAKGKTSRFVATLPETLAGKKFKVTINNIQIGAERFRIEFAQEKHEKH